MNDKEKIFVDKLNKKHNGNIILLDNYINSTTKINFKCKKCNNIWKTKPAYLVRNQKTCGCPNCYKINKVKIYDLDSFKKYIKEYGNNEYELISDKYINSTTKLTLKHKKCNKEYLVKPNDFQQGYRCPYCSHGHSKKDNNEFKNELKNLVGEEYILKSEYKTCQDYIELLHTNCNKTFKVTPRNFISNNTRCPYCKKLGFPNGLSSQCKRINQILEDNNYEYINEQTIRGCKNIRNLRFDYFIPKLNLYIEFDGNQHFIENEYIGKEKLLKYKENDKIKNKFCMDNKINLLRLDNTNFMFLADIIDDFKNKRSTTIEKYNVFIISEYLINDNNKYTK